MMLGLALVLALSGPESNRRQHPTLSRSAPRPSFPDCPGSAVSFAGAAHLLLFLLFPASANP